MRKIDRQISYKQKGISIVLVMFLMAAIGVMAISIGQLSTTQNINSSYSVRGSRTYFAALAGLDYAISRINAGAGCGGIGNFVLDGYDIFVNCASTGPFDEGGVVAFNVFRLDVTASIGGFNVPDASSRQVRATVRFP
jgi:hypothetical protein